MRTQTTNNLVHNNLAHSNSAHDIKFSGVCILIFGLLFSLNGHTANTQAEEEWEKQFTREGITVYTKYKSKIISFRATARIEVHDLYTAIALVEDYSNLSNWFGRISNVSELSRESAKTRYLYGALRVPIIQDRDIIFRVDISQNHKTKSVRVDITGVPDRVPLDPNHVRLPYAKGYLQFDVISETEINATYEINTDPGIDAPLFIKRYVTMLLPYITMINLREQVKNPRYHNQADSIPFLSF